MSDPKIPHETAGGAVGKLAGKVFRLGHMGSQAEMGLVERGMGVLERVLAQGHKAR